MFVSALSLILILVPSLVLAEVGGEATKGREIYKERCVLCHGSKGHGWDWDKKAARPPVPVPNLVNVVPDRSDDQLMTVIRDGGKGVGLTSFMPAFGFNMNEQDIKDVVAYLRSLRASAK